MMNEKNSKNEKRKCVVAVIAMIGITLLLAIFVLYIADNPRPHEPIVKTYYLHVESIPPPIQGNDTCESFSYGDEILSIQQYGGEPINWDNKRIVVEYDQFEPIEMEILSLNDQPNWSSYITETGDSIVVGIKSVEDSGILKTEMKVNLSIIEGDQMIWTSYNEILLI